MFIFEQKDNNEAPMTHLVIIQKTKMPELALGIVGNITVADITIGEWQQKILKRGASGFLTN